MKINKVVELTGISKRTIYYYIEEQLIFPEINSNNGYYIFSDEDVRTLKLLQRLRTLDFSIKDIHNLLIHPKSIHIYLQKQIEKLKREHSLLETRITQITELEKRLPPTAISHNYLAQALEDISNTNQPVPSYFRDISGDAKLVSLYLWGNFLHGVPMTEYRQYLWEKILAETTASDDPHIITLKQFLYSLPAQKIDTEFSKRHLHIEQIVNLTADSIPAYIQTVLYDVEHIVLNEPYLTYWKASYHDRILPSTSLFDSETNALVRELSPRFSAYYNNIHICCAQIYNWLHSKEGGHLRKKMLTLLHGYIDIDSYHQGVLGALLSFPEFFDKNS